MPKNALQATCSKCKETDTVEVGIDFTEAVIYFEDMGWTLGDVVGAEDVCPKCTDEL